MLEMLQNFAQPLQEPPPQSYYKDRLTLYIKSEKLIAKSIELQQSDICDFTQADIG